jgi:hypothetical protein
VQKDLGDRSARIGTDTDMEALIVVDDVESLRGALIGEAHAATPGLGNVGKIPLSPMTLSQRFGSANILLGL